MMATMDCCQETGHKGDTGSDPARNMADVGSGWLPTTWRTLAKGCCPQHGGLRFSMAAHNMVAAPRGGLLCGAQRAGRTGSGPPWRRGSDRGHPPPRPW